MQWSQEVLFVKRDLSGNIIDVQEIEPTGYESDVKWVQIESNPVRSNARYGPMGD